MLSLVDDKRSEVYTSPLCLAIGAYFTAKKNGKILARKKIALLARKLKITTVGEAAVDRALANIKITDFEDGLEYYSSVDAKCSAIVTYDKRDFHFSEVEVLDAGEFLVMYAVRHNKGPL